MKDLQIPLLDMVGSLANTMDLISPALTGHHKHVAGIAVNLAKEVGISQEEQDDLYIAALLHDCGAISLKDRLDALAFDMQNPHKHAIVGHFFLESFRPFEKIAHIVRYHHASWDKYGSSSHNGSRALLESHILHLADRIDVLIDKQRGIIGQTDEICAVIERESGRMFAPDLVDAFRCLSKKEAFWLDIVYSPAFPLRNDDCRVINLDMDGIDGLAKLFEKIIDFRSRFTSTHSSGVAAVGEALACAIGLPGEECRLMKVAGCLHDLGKLAVPAEILEKPGTLSVEEFNIVRCHTYYSYRILSNISGFKYINEAASYHHERLSGKGYPFHLKGPEMPIHSRIMAVSDIFTALTEDRPYRKGMDSDRVMQIIKKLAMDEELDRDIVSQLDDDYGKVNSARMDAQSAAAREYESYSNSMAAGQDFED